MIDDLRKLIDSQLLKPSAFDIRQFSDDTYDATFPGVALPNIDLGELAGKLSATISCGGYSDRYGFEAVLFQGRLKGRIVNLHLRAED